MGEQTLWKENDIQFTANDHVQKLYISKRKNYEKLCLSYKHYVCGIHYSSL